MSKQSILNVTSTAENVWHMLHGIFVVFKPPGEHIFQTRHTLATHLCRDLNNTLEQREQLKHLSIEGETNKEMKVSVRPSYADHVLVTGPRYLIKRTRLVVANSLYKDSSGIAVFGVGNSTRIANEIRASKAIKFYKVKGILGQATDNFFKNGKIVEKSTFEHVKRHHIDKICASMQSSHQRQMFKQCGVDIQSQAAYELAVQGPLRPVDNKIPVVYSIKCIDYKPPEFTLEIVCTNEYEMYLKGLIHELGMQVRSTATCTQIQCVRFGIFTLEHALLKKHWNLRCITHNIAMCLNLINENKFMTKPLDPILREYSDLPTIESSTKLMIKA